MLDDRLSNSLMIAPLVVHVELNCGGSGDRAISGVEAIIIWLAGSGETGSWYGRCGMHGCSSARTKSMAVSIVSTRAVALAAAGGRFLELDDERFIVFREKSCGRLQPDTFIW